MASAIPRVTVFITHNSADRTKPSSHVSKTQTAAYSTCSKITGSIKESNDYWTKSLSLPPCSANPCSHGLSQHQRSCLRVLISSKVFSANAGAVYTASAYFNRCGRRRCAGVERFSRLHRAISRKLRNNRFDWTRGVAVLRPDGSFKHKDPHCSAAVRSGNVSRRLRTAWKPRNAESHNMLQKQRFH